MRFKALVISPFDPYLASSSQFAAAKRQAELLRSISEIKEAEFTYLTQSKTYGEMFLYSELHLNKFRRKSTLGALIQLIIYLFIKTDLIIVFYPGDWKSILISIIAKFRKIDSWVVVNEAPEIYHYQFKGVRKIIRKMFYKYFIKIFKQIITPSQILADRLSSPMQICKIVPLVCAENFGVIGANRNCKVKKIFFTGDLEKGKDSIELIISSVSKINNLVELHVYGSTSSVSRLEDLKHLVNELNAPVFFHGHVKYEQLKIEMKKADVFILLRENNLQNSNGFPSKLSDYVGNRKPIIINNFGEVSKHLELDLLNLVQLDENSVAEKIENVINNYDLALQKATRLHNYFVEKYSYKSIGEYLLD